MQSVTSREVFLVTKSWLSVFQQDLNVALDANTLSATYASLSTTYTPIQMVDGVEALINIAAGVSSSYQAHRTKKSTFQVNLANNRQALKSIYEQAYQAYLTHKASVGESAVPISVMVEIDSVKNGSAFVSTKSILGLSATIVGENKVCRFDLAQLTATVSGPGLPTGQSYQYEWKHNLTGTNWDATPGAGTNSTVSIASGSLAVGTVIFVRLKVTTPNGTILYDFHSIQVFDHHILCERFEAGRSLSNPIKVSPNPASSSINVTFFVEERSDITINLYTANGVLRQSVSKRTFDTGTYTEMVDLSNIENSFNYIEVINGNKIDRLPIIVIK